MITMIYHPEPGPITAPREATTITLTTPVESLDAVLEDIERFLRAVYGFIPTDEHLYFGAIDD